MYILFAVKLVIATGSPYDESIKVEVIDLENDHISCSFPNFPTSKSGAFGLQSGYQWPLICGGESMARIKSDCHHLKNGSVFDLTGKRAVVSSINFEDKSVLLGGYDSNWNALKTVEVFNHDSKIFSSKPDLPVTFTAGCAVKFKENFWILGGKQDGSALSKQTWKSKHLENWMSGPNLKQNRCDHKCGVISNHNLLFVIGGSTRFRNSKVEVLSATETEFEFGLDLPHELSGMSVVSHPNGNSLVVSGGFDSRWVDQSKIWRLDCFSTNPNGCQWHQYKQKMELPRHSHLSFFIKSSEFNCSSSN